MRLSEIICRLTGFSVPIFGISWNPPELDIKKVRRVIAFLEDRRVFYVPFSWEVPEHCIQSIIEIRHFLTSEITGANPDGELTATLRAMRAACRKFLSAVGVPDEQIRISRGHNRGRLDDWQFHEALGELRGVFGIHVAQLAVQYGLGVEDELASILPTKLEDSDNQPNSSAEKGDI